MGNTTETPQEEQAPVWNVRDGVRLSRLDGKKDLVPVEFPSVPDRYRVAAAYRLAVGYREGDEKDEPSGDYNQGDSKACAWAALGLCWRGRAIELPNFRDLGRDVVAYGEQAMTALWFAGYRESLEQMDAGFALMKAFMAECNSAEERARSDFPKAQRRG